jgi:hypothetical protein
MGGWVCTWRQKQNRALAGYRTVKRAVSHYTDRAMFFLQSKKVRFKSYKIIRKLILYSVYDIPLIYCKSKVVPVINKLNIFYWSRH